MSDSSFFWFGGVVVSEVVELVTSFPLCAGFEVTFCDVLLLKDDFFSSLFFSFTSVLEAVLTGLAFVLTSADVLPTTVSISSLAALLLLVGFLASSRSFAALVV